MMKKTTAAIIAVVVVAGVVAGVVRLRSSKRAVTAVAGYAEVMPECTWLYVDLQGLDDVKERSPVFDIIKDIRALGMTEDIRRILEAAGESKGSDREITQALAALDWIRRLVSEVGLGAIAGREVAIAAFDHGEDRLPSVVAAARVEEAVAERLQQELATILDAAVEAAAGKVVVERWESNGTGVSTAVVAGLDEVVKGLSPSFAFPQGHAFFSSSREGMEELLAGLGGTGRASLADSERYQQIVSRLPGEGEGLSYFDIERAASLVRQCVEGPLRELADGEARGISAKVDVDAVLHYAAAYLSLVESAGVMAVRTSYTEKGLKQDGYVLPKKSALKGEHAAWFSVKPGKFRSSEFVPREVTSYQASVGLGPGLVHGYDWVKGLMADDPMYGKPILEKWERIQEEGGWDLEKEVLPLFGDEFACVMLSVGGSIMGSPGSFAYLLEVTDEVLTRTALEKMARMVVEQEGAGIGFSTDEYEGVEITRVVLPMSLVILQPSYAVKDGFLIIASDRASLEEIIDCRAGRSETIRENAKVRALAEYLSGAANSICFTDTERQLDGMVTSLESVLAMQRMMMMGREGRGDAEGKAALELMEKAVKAVKMLRAVDADVQRTVFDGRGYRVDRFISIPGRAGGE